MNSKIGNHDHVLSKMNAQTQLEFMLKTRPIIDAIQSVEINENDSPEERQEKQGTAVFDGIGRLTDEVRNSVINIAATHCRRLAGAGALLPIVAAKGQFLFTDIDYQFLVTLIVESINFNLMGFTSTSAPASLPAAAGS